MNLQGYTNMYNSDSSDEDSDPDTSVTSNDELNDPKVDENGQDAGTDDTTKDDDTGKDDNTSEDDNTSNDDNNNSEPGETKRNKISISGEDPSVALAVSGFDIEIENDGKRFEIRGDNNVITVSGENNYILVVGANNRVTYQEGNEIRMEGEGNTASSGDEDAQISSSGIIHIRPNNGTGGVGIVDRIRGMFGGNPQDGNGNGPNLMSLGIAAITGSGPVTRRRSRMAAQMGDGDAPAKIPRHAISTAPRSTSAINVASQQSVERRNLVEQQNKEYEDSLQADQEKERIKQEKVAQEEQMKARQEEIEKLKAEALARLPAEPAETEADIITLAFRFPNGQLVRRNFRRTDTLSTVQDFVLSRAETPVPFEIIQYPNRAVGGNGEEPGLQTLGEFGIKAESLHVRKQTAEDDDESEDDDVQDDDEEM